MKVEVIDCITLTVMHIMGYIRISLESNAILLESKVLSFLKVFLHLGPTTRYNQLVIWDVPKVLITVSLET